MAIHGKGSNNNNTSMADAFANANVPPQDAQVKREREEHTRERFKHVDISGMFNNAGLMPVLNTNRSGSVDLEAFYLSALETVETINKTYEDVKNGPFNVFKIINSVHDLNYSGIAVSFTLGNLTAVHTLLVESTGHYPETQPLELVQGYEKTTYEFIAPPSFAFDSKLANVVMGTVRETLRLSESDRVRWVNGTLIPTEYRLKDAVENGAADDFLDVAFNSIQADICTEIGNYSGMSLQNITANIGSFFAVNVEFVNDLHRGVGSAATVDITGLPIRQDIRIILSMKQHNKPRTTTVNHNNAGCIIAETAGYIDFLWQPAQQDHAVNPFMQAMQQQYVSLQTFMANFIITEVSSPMFVVTEHINILGLASVGSIWKDRMWVQAFSRKYAPVKGSKSKLRFDDVGVLAIEAGTVTQDPANPYAAPQRSFSAPLDTTPKEFGFEQTQNLINALVSPNMLISIDVPESSPNTWSTAIYRSMSKINSPSEEERDEAYNARDRYYGAINTLMGGSEDHVVYGDNGIPMFVDFKNLIHGGYFNDGSEVRDLRYLSSYLTVAAYHHDHGQNYPAIGLYNGSVSNQNIDIRIRAADRFHLIQEMAMGTAVVKQYFLRLTFNGTWLANLIGQLKATGFNVDTSSVHFGDNIFTPQTFDLRNAGIDPSLSISSNFGFTQSVNGAQFNFYAPRF